MSEGVRKHNSDWHIRHRPDEQHRVLIGQDPLGLVALGYRDIACVIVVKQHKTRQISFQDLCGASNSVDLDSTLTTA